MTNNIYEPPSSSVDLDDDNADKELATTMQRFLNFIIDTIIYYIISFAYGVVLAIIDRNDFIEGVQGTITSLLIIYAYFAIPEAIWGRTPAKFITKTIVVNEEFGKVSVGQALGRSLIRFVPFEIFSYLGGDGHPRGWHDSWSRTKVISLKNS